MNAFNSEAFLIVKKDAVVTIATATIKA